jgi:hypothetical protein
MECHICQESCNLPTDTKPSSKFAVILADGRIVCNQCQDVLDWADTCGISKDKLLVKTNPNENHPQTKQSQITKDVTTNQTKKTSGVVTIRCPKCKSQFSGRVCSCGFKNPLFR